MTVYLKGIFVMLLLLMGAFVSTTVDAAEDTPKDGRVRLHVAASDPYGGKLAFKWEQLEGPEGKILDSAAAAFDDKGKKWVSETYFIPSKPGKYTVQVTVTSDAGLVTKKTYVLEAKKSSSE